MATNHLSHIPSEATDALRNEQLLADVIRSQVQFGRAYAREARVAYSESRCEYAKAAQTIAVNSYSAAARFAARLNAGMEPELRQELDVLRSEVLAVLPEAPREIA